MKHSLRIALALLVIAALGLGMFAMAEGVVEPETIEGIEGLENEVEIENDDMGELNLALGDLVSEGPEAPATAVYRFIVNETEYQVQQVRDGAAVLPPENPAAPEGMAFEAWVLETGAPLFVDADGNGEIDPVIANAEAQPEVKVWASFKQVESQPTEEQPADEEPTEGSPEPSPATEGSDSGEGGAAAPEEVVPPAEPITGEEGEGEAMGVPEEAPVEEQPADDQPTEGTPEPSPATEGSDSGEGGAEAPEEVVPQTEATTGEEGEGEATSSDSPDGEPASPKGEALGVPGEAPAEEQPAEEQPAEEQPAEEAPAEEAPADEQPTDEEPTDEQPTDAAPIANALTYTGEAQALVSGGEGWLYSLDGATYSADIPTAVDAGEYTVFFKAAEDAGAQALTVTVAKADVVLIPPEALTEGE